jgi:predicted ester cyclase
MAIAPAETASNTELLAWAFECLNEHDTTPLRGFWTDATVERFPDATTHGTDEIAAYFDAAFAALPDLRIDVVKLVADGEDAFVHWHLTGHHTGAAWNGIAATGRPIELDGIDHFVIRDRKVVSNFVVFDQLQFARAVGMMPPDGSAADRGLKAAFSARVKLAERLAARRQRQAP